MSNLVKVLNEKNRSYNGIKKWETTLINPSQVSEYISYWFSIVKEASIQEKSKPIEKVQEPTIEETQPEQQTPKKK